MAYTGGRHGTTSNVFPIFGRRDRAAENALERIRTHLGQLQSGLITQGEAISLINGACMDGLGERPGAA